MKRQYIVGLGCCVVSVAMIFGFTWGQEKGEFKVGSAKKVVSGATSIDPADTFATVDMTPGDMLVNFDSAPDIYDYVELVVVGTVEEKKNAQMIEDQLCPYTPGKIKVERVLKGQVDGNKVDFYIMGGSAKLKDYEEALIEIAPEKITKPGIDKLPQSEKASKYITFENPYAAQFEKGKRYVIMLNPAPFGYICFSRAGFIEVDADQNISSIEDVLYAS